MNGLTTYFDPFWMQNDTVRRGLGLVSQATPELIACLMLLSWFMYPKEDVQRRHTVTVMTLVGLCGAISTILAIHAATFFHVNPRSLPDTAVALICGVEAGSQAGRIRWIRYPLILLAAVNLFEQSLVSVISPIVGEFLGLTWGLIIWRSSAVYVITHVLRIISVALEVLFEMMLSSLFQRKHVRD